MIDPINRQVFRWEPENTPADWEQLRDRWHALHRVRGVLTATAFGTSILSLICETKQPADARVPTTPAA